MEDKRVDPVPYLVYEGEMARQERHIKRLWVLCIIIFAALIMTNAGWIYYESQFEEVVTVTQDTPSGNNNYIGNNGNITNGTSNYHENPETEDWRQERLP